MDFDLPPDDDPRRLAVRAFLAEHPSPSRTDLARAGYVAPHWPKPWGLGADPEHQLILDTEFAAADVDLGGASIGVGWAGPTLLAGGTPEQQQRWLPGILDGSEEWSQLFSEPDAGSDLASLRTQAIRDGDVYVLNGQKIWSTWANSSQWGILIARTDPAAQVKTGRRQDGISYFALDLSLPGIEIRPIIEMTGGNHFNEVFFNDVRVPLDCRIGPEHQGWRLAKVTLGNERLSLSEGGVIWGMGPTSEDFFSAVRPEPHGTKATQAPGPHGTKATQAPEPHGTKASTVAEPAPLDDPLLRQRAASVYTDAKLIELLGYRIMTMLLDDDPGAEAFASLRKTLADVHGQRITTLMKDLLGSSAMLGEQSHLAEADDPWHWAYLFSRALTIGGGTSEVQRNIIGERILGLPREP